MKITLPSNDMHAIETRGALCTRVHSLHWAQKCACVSETVAALLTVLYIYGQNILHNIVLVVLNGNFHACTRHEMQTFLNLQSLWRDKALCHSSPMAPVHFNMQLRMLSLLYSTACHLSNRWSKHGARNARLLIDQ